MNEHDFAFERLLIDAGLPKDDPLRIIVERLMAAVHAQDQRNKQTMRVVGDALAAITSATQQITGAIDASLALDLDKIKRRIRCLDHVAMETSLELFMKHYSRYVTERGP